MSLDGELLELVPASLRGEGLLAKLRVTVACAEGDPLVRRLELAVLHTADDDSRRAVSAILRHPAMCSLKELTIGRSRDEWPAPTESDFGWVIDLVADEQIPLALDFLWISGGLQTSLTALARWSRRPKRVGASNKLTRFTTRNGSFHDITRLDLRDTDVAWPVEADAFPDLQTLTLRPRGPRSIGPRWVAPIFQDPRVLPRLQTLRANERYGDDIVALLLDSPMIERLRELDLTDALTDHGARLLHSEHARLQRLEKLWVGSTNHGPRAELRRLMHGRRNSAEMPPSGDLEVSDPWRSRLRERFGNVVRFEAPPGHPNL